VSLEAMIKTKAIEPSEAQSLSKCSRKSFFPLARVPRKNRGGLLYPKQEGGPSLQKSDSHHHTGDHPPRAEINGRKKRQTEQDRRKVEK